MHHTITRQQVRNQIRLVMTVVLTLLSTTGDVAAEDFDQNVYMPVVQLYSVPTSGEEVQASSRQYKEVKVQTYSDNDYNGKIGDGDTFAPNVIVTCTNGTITDQRVSRRINGGHPFTTFYRFVVGDTVTCWAIDNTSNFVYISHHSLTKTLNDALVESMGLLGMNEFPLQNNIFVPITGG